MQCARYLNGKHSLNINGYYKLLLYHFYLSNILQILHQKTKTKQNIFTITWNIGILRMCQIYVKTLQIKKKKLQMTRYLVLKIWPFYGHWGGYLGASRPMLLCVTLSPLIKCPKTVKILTVKGLKVIHKCTANDFKFLQR